jgi:hypothetical protein
MVKLLSIIFTLLILGSSLMAQKSTIAGDQKLEYFLGVGTTSYFGEVGGPGNDATGLFASFDNLGWDPQQTRFGITGGARFGIKNNMALVTSVSPLWLSGNDKNSARENRGYAFNTFLLNASAIYEIYLNTTRIEFSPFIGTGVGASFWKSKNNTETKLKPGISSAFTFILGGRLPSRSKITQNIQIEFNYLFTDKMDGLPGNRNVGDTYYFLKYCVNLEMDQRFNYSRRGLIR